LVIENGEIYDSENWSVVMLHFDAAVECLVLYGDAKRNGGKKQKRRKDETERDKKRGRQQKRATSFVCLTRLSLRSGGRAFSPRRRKKPTRLDLECALAIS
jgi:hypothetical protein